ncbi:hypothetical protein Pmani_006624 [Petrolisthes manimaculis]|uniref:Uncharacterized protein n=1 Tax=Petrolisthes manimaculis TaxID=1843537 RepID=A0AAE1QCI3_9EUCA|nr:hypothetical protein Pmani_006624 [Petrolisthes manimaculis]
MAPPPIQPVPVENPSKQWTTSSENAHWVHIAPTKIFWMQTNQPHSGASGGMKRYDDDLYDPDTSGLPLLPTVFEVQPELDHGY